MIFVPMLTAHLDGFELQEAQSEMEDWIKIDGYADMLINSGSAYACINDGMVKALGGLADQGDGRSLVWALISKHLTGFEFVGFTKKCKQIVDEADKRRLEIIVKDGFDQGHRWAKMLGFRCETPDGMVNWFENNTKAYLYARAK